MNRTRPCLTALCLLLFGLDAPHASAQSDIPTNGPTNTRWVADIELLQANWPGPEIITTLEDAFRVRVIGKRFSIVADTHLFDEPITIIPYSDADGSSDANGVVLERGDAVLAEHFPPGEIGFAIKFHRPAHRSLSLDEETSSSLMRDLKLQDTHMGAIIGVRRAGMHGVITVNNPQGYDNGRFGSVMSSMLILRPEYLAYLNEARRLAFRDNIRTMLVGFNAVSSFPLKYDGGDPLGAYDIASVTELTAMMVRAVVGDENAAAWFRKSENLIYCAENVHTAFSAGLLLPLNARTMIPLVGKEVWATFVDNIAEHNRGRKTPFTELNQNEYIRLIELATASEELEPITAYTSPEMRAEPGLLAFRPMSMSNMLDSFLQMYAPRPRYTKDEAIISVQLELLEKAREMVLDAAYDEPIEENDPRRLVYNILYDHLVKAVGELYASYGEYREEVKPILAKIDRLLTDSKQPGESLYVPPSMYHLQAQGAWPDGLIGVEYVGHGLHLSLVHREDGDALLSQP